jgi:hypothetical protein
MKQQIYALIVFVILIVLSSRLDVNSSSVAISFIGALATFVVVSNIVQVQEVKRNFDKKMRNSLEREKDNLSADFYAEFATTSFLYKKYEVSIIYLTQAIEKYIKIENYDKILYLLNELNIYTHKKYHFNQYYKEIIIENLTEIENVLNNKHYKGLVGYFKPIKNEILDKFNQIIKNQ